EFFFVFGRPNLTRDQIAGLQIETANLRRRYVDVFRAGEIIETLRAQEAVAIGQHFKHTFGEQYAGAFGIFLEDVENDLVLAHRAVILHGQIFGHVVQVVHLHRLKFGDVERVNDFIAFTTATVILRRRWRWRFCRLRGNGSLNRTRWWLQRCVFVHGGRWWRR